MYKRQVDRGIILEIIEYPKIIFANKPFETLTYVRNNMAMPVSVDIYSYVFSGRKLLSYGKKKGRWVKGWDANRQSFTIPANDYIIVRLENMIVNTKGGNYSLRVRVKINKTKIDRTRIVYVKVGKNVTNASREYKNITNESEEKNISYEGDKMSGMVAARSLWDDILNFFLYIIKIFTGP